MKSYLGFVERSLLEPPRRWRLKAVLFKHFRSGQSFLRHANIPQKDSELSLVLRGLMWPSDELRKAFCVYLGISEQELRDLLTDGWTEFSKGMVDRY